MKFVLKMAWREARASWRRLLLFFMCIAIGVGSIVAVKSFTQTMKGSVSREVRSLFGGDVRVGLNQPWKPETRAILERYSTSPLATGYTELFETQTMVRPVEDQAALPVMVQLVALQPQFPLYGKVHLSDGSPYSHSLLQNRGALVPPRLLSQLNIKVGDVVSIGLARFTVRGTWEKLPGNGTNFSPVPRVAVDFAEIEKAGLTTFGSRGRYSWLFKTREGEDDNLLKELQRELRTTRLNGLGSFRHQQDFMNTVLERLEGFLGLVGLSILILGGIGISSVARVFVQQKMKTIAILKCLGGNNRQVLSTYLTQIVGLSFLGSASGLVLAVVITFLGARYTAGRLPLEFEPGLTWQASLQGIGIGMLVSLLFSLPPLLEIRQIKPILVLRQNVAAARKRIDWVSLGAAFLILPALLGLASWQSGSMRNAGLFLGGLVVTAVILNLVGVALMALLKRVRRVRSFVLRYGINSLYRPGNQTRVILFTVGLGALFIIAIRQQQVNVENLYRFDLDTMAVDMFMIDIQKDQRVAAEKMVTRMGGTDLLFIPVVQGRIIGLRREGSTGPSPTASPNRAQGDDSRRRLGWEQRFSYRPRLDDGETIVAGKFWDATPSTEPEISVEEWYSEMARLGIGDKLIFDFLGQRVEARVTSIRRLERRMRPVSFLGRFNIIFRPGVLESAPQTYIGAAKGPPPGERRSQLHRQFVEEFPNVTAVDAFETIAELRRRLSEISFAVSLIGGFVFLSGALILSGSIAMTKLHRLYESAILKTLGARKRVIVLMTLVEYGVLGLLAGSIGSVAAIGLTWAIAKYGMKIPWELAPSVNLSGIGMTLLLVGVVGVISSWDVMTKKPLGILRTE